MKKETLITQKGRNSENAEGAVNPPLVQTSTVLFPTIEDYHAAERGRAYYPEMDKSSASDFGYGIAGTSTTFALQQLLCELEHASQCVLVPSGLSAITTTYYALLDSGDHVLLTDGAYGPNRRFCTKVLKKMGVEVSYYDPAIAADALEALIQPNTKLLFLESPSSLTFELQDIDPLVKLAKQHGILTAFDNSWASPLFFNPLEHGIDICIQALTKYIGGHSDVLMGAILSKDANINKKLLNYYQYSGLATSPHDCWLVLRGARSLAARMHALQQNVEKVAAFMKASEHVDTLLFPADPDFPQHDLYQKYFSGTGSLFSVVLKEHISKEQVHAFINSLQLFGIGASWGGYESLVLDFDPRSIRTATSWAHKGHAVRFYIGLENPDDLITDLEKGMGCFG